MAVQTENLNLPVLGFTDFKNSGKPVFQELLENRSLQNYTHPLIAAELVLAKLVNLELSIKTNSSSMGCLAPSEISCHRIRAQRLSRQNTAMVGAAQPPVNTRLLEETTTLANSFPRVRQTLQFVFCCITAQLCEMKRGIADKEVNLRFCERFVLRRISE